jgi:hypothetical protein
MVDELSKNAFSSIMIDFIGLPWNDYFPSPILHFTLPIPHARHLVIPRRQHFPQTALRSSFVAGPTEQELDGFAFGVDDTIEIDLFAIDLQIGLIQLLGVVRG